jgi:hypothetical protein
VGKEGSLKTRLFRLCVVQLDSLANTYDLLTKAEDECDDALAKASRGLAKQAVVKIAAVLSRIRDWFGEVNE